MKTEKRTYDAAPWLKFDDVTYFTELPFDAKLCLSPLFIQGKSFYNICSLCHVKILNVSFHFFSVYTCEDNAYRIMVFKQQK